MPSAKVDLIKNSIVQTVDGPQELDLAIRQGTTFSLPWELEGDWTTGTFRGMIRTDYYQRDKDTDGNPNPPLAEFVFSNVTFIPGDPLPDPPIPDITRMLITIPSSVTEALEATIGVPSNARGIKNQGYRVYDWEYEESGIVYRLYEGLVEITPESTRQV